MVTKVAIRGNCLSLPIEKQLKLCSCQLHKLIPQEVMQKSLEDYCAFLGNNDMMDNSLKGN